MRQIAAVAFAFLVANSIYAQDSPDYRITISDNIRVAPNSLNTTFPLVYRAKRPTEKNVIGGFGIGISRFFYINSKFDLKTSVNLSRQVYWNDAVSFNKGPLPQDNLGYGSFVSKEYYVEPVGVVHYKLGKGFSAGLGLGFQIMISSITDVKQSGLFANNNEVDNPRNRQYKPVMPVVPLEVSWKGRLMLFNIHGEAGLLNRYRSDLADLDRSFFGLLSFEVGMRL